MKRIIKYFVPAILLASCSGQNKTEPLPPPLFPAPVPVEANPAGGYLVNPVTGDSIVPMTLSNGNRLLTGVPVPAMPNILLSDSLTAPQVIQVNVGPIKTRIAHPNRHKVPEHLYALPINQSGIETVEMGKGNPTFVLRTQSGDTIPTGVAIPAPGKVVKAIHTQVTPALPAAFKDAATSDLKYLDVDQGMKSSYVHTLLQDKRGNLWFGTHNGGVSKYDGRSFTHFTEKEGLSSNGVLASFEDRHGNLWFGTGYGGVCKYDGNSFTHFTEKEGMSSNVVNVIFEDSKGNLWFGTDGGGVSRFDGTSLFHFTAKEGLSDNLVFSISEDRNGNLWFGTARGGVNKFDGKRFSHYTTKAGLNSNVVLAITEDKEGNLWFGTWGAGAIKFDGKTIVHYTKDEGLSDNYIKVITEDRDGNLWFGTRDGGVNKFDGTAFTHYTENEGLSNNTTWSVLQDKEGNMWFGTKGGGVCMLNERSFKIFNEATGLSENIVHVSYEDNHGNLWFGTKGGGVVKYDGESFTNFTDQDGLSNNHVWAIVEDNDGDLWFGTWGGGVTRFNGKTFQHYTEKQGMSSNYVWNVLKDSRGNLWFGTSNGVTRYDGVSFGHFTEREGLGNNNVVSITEDTIGNIWFGTWGGGLNKFDGNSITHFTQKEGLLNNNIKSVMADSSGNIWFTSWEEGVTRFDGRHFEHFTKTEGLSSNVVWSFMQDNRFQIWIGTEQGLTAIDTRKNNLVRSFGKQDGLKGQDFYANSAFIDSKNRAWWGSGKGLTMLDMDQFVFAKNPPMVSLSQIEIHGEALDFRNLSDSLHQIFDFKEVQPFENFPLNLKLPYDQNHLTFHFSGIDWKAPHKVKYSYKMGGLNEQWSQPGPEGKADFRSMPYGNYNFNVRAIGESGEWSEPFIYSFSISPPWWHTWWSRTAYGLGAVLLMAGFVKWRTTKLKQRQTELEKEVAMATVEIRNQKELAEKQRDEVKVQKEMAEQANQEIKDSINYAKRIQNAILPPMKLIKEYLPDSFILYKPKDIVAGDFYWMERKEGMVMFAAADCTGHGVPGAMVSVVCNNGLNRSVREHGITEPGKILDKTREIVIAEFEKSEEEVKDGMDISLCVMDGRTLHWSGANNPLWVIRNGELIEFKANKQPIGKYADAKPFASHRLEIQKGDCIYIFTDGFQDQFGGEKGKKFKPANLKKLLTAIHHETMERQEEIISETFDNWKGSLDQVDDVCLIGVKI